MPVESLPKGVRKEVRIGGLNILLFWYRNEICAIETRSPAEGAYSEGFIKAMLNQNYQIECPSTGTLFSLKTGEIIEWYPNNPVLRLLTPKEYCRPMRVYPVEIKQEAIFVDISSGGINKVTKGGAGTALENNNVYGLEPKVYIEGTDPSDPTNDSSSGGTPFAATAVTLVAGFVGVGILATGGTAVFIYYENLVGLAIFWIILFSLVATYIYSTVLKNV
jgi:nitrite reductase/ring-hydroxylating ferredoxin subunit